MSMQEFYKNLENAQDIQKQIKNIAKSIVEMMKFTIQGNQK